MTPATRGQTPKRRGPRYLAQAADTKGDRTCLGCDRTFRSHGPGNRICPDCRARQGVVGLHTARRMATLPRKGVGSM